MLKGGTFFFNVFTLTCALVPNKIGLAVARAFQGTYARLSPATNSTASMM